MKLTLSLNTNPLADVFGNTLVQQITSTFDVALCVLALALLGIVLAAGRRRKSRRPAPQRAAVAAPQGGEVAAPQRAAVAPPSPAPEQPATRKS